MAALYVIVRADGVSRLFDQVYNYFMETGTCATSVILLKLFYQFKKKQLIVDQC